MFGLGKHLELSSSCEGTFDSTLCSIHEAANRSMYFPEELDGSYGMYTDFALAASRRH
jgi:hypothetical protein